MMEANLTEQAKERQLDSMEIYPVLRKAILDLYVCPGTELSIRNLCEYYHAGRSPVRDAVMRLQQEGLVTILPQRGIMVSLIDLDIEAQERYMRLAVETAVTRDFAVRHTTDQLREAERLLQQQVDWLQHGEGDYRSFLDLDDAFHEYFYVAMGQDFCFRTMQQSGGFYRRMRLLCCQVQQMSLNLEQHGLILQAVRTGDADGVARALSNHLQKLDYEEKELQEKYPYMFKGTQIRASAQHLDVDFLRAVYGGQKG